MSEHKYTRGLLAAELVARRQGRIVVDHEDYPGGYKGADGQVYVFCCECGNPENADESFRTTNDYDGRPDFACVECSTEPTEIRHLKAHQDEKGPHFSIELANGDYASGRSLSEAVSGLELKLPEAQTVLLKATQHPLEVD